MFATQLSLTLLLALAMVAGVRVGAAQAGPERAVWIAVAGELPCTEVELDEAVAVRLAVAAPSPTALRVDVRGDGDRVTIQVTGRVRTLTLAGERGAAAARIVALAITDLTMAELEPPQPAAPARVVDDARLPGPAAAAPARPGVAVSLGLFGTVGAGDDLMAGGVVAGLSVPRGRWRLVGEAGVGRSASFDAAGTPVEMLIAPVRVGAGYTWGRFELRGVGTVVPYQLQGGYDDTFVLGGVGVNARVAVTQAGGGDVVVAGGVDVFTTHVEYQARGSTVLDVTPGLLWLAMGMSWDVGGSR